MGRREENVASKNKGLLSIVTSECPEMLLKCSQIFVKCSQNFVGKPSGFHILHKDI